MKGRPPLLDRCRAGNPCVTVERGGVIRLAGGQPFKPDKSWVAHPCGFCKGGPIAALAPKGFGKSFTPPDESSSRRAGPPLLVSLPTLPRKRLPHPSWFSKGGNKRTRKSRSPESNSGLSDTRRCLPNTYGYWTPSATFNRTPCESAVKLEMAQKKGKAKTVPL